MDDENYDNIIFTDFFNQKNDLFYLKKNSNNKNNIRTDRDINKMFQQVNEEYKRKYGGLYKR